MSILVKIITEKANELTEKLNRYSFYVKLDANKIQVEAVEAHGCQ